MGGLAIKKIIGKEGERFSKEEYETYKEDISRLFFNPDFFEFAFPEEIRSKETFGDLDVIIYSGIGKRLFFALMESRFRTKGYDVQGSVTNGDTVSYAINNKQIDFIFVQNVEIAYYYFSGNDLGNLLGRIAHSIGLRFGHDGLKYIFRDKENRIGEILLSQDFGEILDTLGFENETMDKIIFDGFETFEEMYETVTLSKYFDGSKYKLENLNSINRVRNAKRTTYMNFIKYLEETGSILKKPKMLIDKEYMALNAISKFGKEKEYFDILKLKSEREYYSKLFNGQKVMKLLPNLKGKELGTFIAFFKEKYDWKKLSPQEIERLILEEGSNETTGC